MIPTSTPLDLLQTLYHEDDAQHQLDVQARLEANPEMAHNFEDLEHVIKTLDKALAEPEESSIERIMQYVRNR